MNVFLLWSGGFSHDEMITIAALHHSRPMQVPTFYMSKQLSHTTLEQTMMVCYQNKEKK